ncbi:MAG: DUF4040 domain-containing protein [Anaerolineales bacterium]|nr:DUF4040 domain-containing protein [Anaerolineales bacterium]
MPVTVLVWSLFLGVLMTALASPVHRLLNRWASLLALYPLAIFIQLCLAVPEIAAGEVWQTSVEWVPSLGLSLTFTLDGLGLVMALLISGIGALVIVYGEAYLHGYPFLGRFHSLVILFMTAMLGVVLSGNALLLFVFWELTSISSFFLIGFEHSKPNARAAAWQALLVTGSGGLAMMAGFVLLGSITGSFEISRWIALSASIPDHPLAPAAFVLVLAGALTKSAQFPFHFWLPNAMEAPTPVSAYLHSATMVKAGIYLLARLYPVLSGLSLWTPVLTTIGLVTLLGGALLALAQTDLKRLLAYTTVSGLGALTFYLGLGTPIAVKTAVVFLITHALYKGALFLVAGGVDHGTGTRDINALGKIGKAMPYTAAAAGLAATSMAGIPPLLGFIAKELAYESTLESSMALVFTVLVLVANAATVTVAVWMGYASFWGKPGSDDLHPHEGSPALWVPPLLLASTSLVFGLFPALLADWLAGPAVQAVLQAPFRVKLALWHGLTPMLALSLVTMLLGVGAAVIRKRLQSLSVWVWHLLAKIGPARMYPRTLHAVLNFAAWQTRLLQNGYLRGYVLVIVLFTVGLVGLTFFLRVGSFAIPPGSLPRFYDLVLIAVILTATFLALRSRSRLATIALLGSVGFSIAIIFLLYSAPDLAMVQFAVETLTVILFVLVLYRLPKFSRLSSRLVRLADGIVAILSGAMMTLLMLLVSTHNSSLNLARYFAENSAGAANGRNIVNVILVDFRGMDTLGEITVLSIAAIGVVSLMQLTLQRPKRRRVIPKEGKS